jgi:AcrR family transcriptional regulator
VVTRASPAPRLDTDVIVDTAAALVDADGIDSLSLSAVAARLGVTQPALYRHVENADDLLRRVALHARLELLATISDAAIARSGPDALDAVAAAWRAYATSHPDRYAATDRSPLAGDTENEAVVERIVDVISRVVGGFGLDDPDARQGAWAVRSALHGFVILEAETGNPQRLELDAAFAHMIDLLAAGFRNQALEESGPPRAC